MDYCGKEIDAAERATPAQIALYFAEHERDRNPYDTKMNSICTDGFLAVVAERRATLGVPYVEAQVELEDAVKGEAEREPAPTRH